MMDPWVRILRFESTDQVKRLYYQRHNRQINSGKAKEIVSTLTQGREYFGASSKAGELIQPLLQYYGVLSLSRGLILFVNPKLRETALSQSHGLSAKKWKETFSTGLRHLDALEIEIKTGTFSQLLKTTQNIERSVIYQAPYPKQIVLTRKRNFSDVEGKTITTKDLFARIPDLFDSFENTFDESPQCSRGFVFNFAPNTQTDIDIFPGCHGLPEENSLRALFSISIKIDMTTSDSHNFRRPIRHWSYRILHSTVDEMAQTLPSLENDEAGEIYLVAPFPGKFYLSILAKLFITSYFLGMLVRYYPKQWFALMNREKGDFMLPLVREALNLVQRKFPILILDELEIGKRSLYDK